MKNKEIKPFVKWVGGKGKVISQISQYFPDMTTVGAYVEPFVGGGAMLFYILNNYPHIEHITINDINSRLIATYNAVCNFPEELIKKLEILQKNWDNLKTQEEKSEYYYQKRKIFNLISENEGNFIECAALFIFLNKTGFNGLYRVNSNNEFNVPCGRYEHPVICDRENIREISKTVRQVLHICNTDFKNTLNHNDRFKTLYYLDPPYMPITKTASFTSYTKEGFGEKEQCDVKEFCDLINQNGDYFMLSNSHPEDEFFENLYKDYNIYYIEAPRAIAAKSDSRKPVKEVLITNF